MALLQVLVGGTRAFPAGPDPEEAGTKGIEVVKGDHHRETCLFQGPHQGGIQVEPVVDVDYLGLVVPGGLEDQARQPGVGGQDPVGLPREPVEPDPLDPPVFERKGLPAGAHFLGPTGHPYLAAPGGLAAGELEEVAFRTPLEFGGEVVGHVENTHFSCNLPPLKKLHLQGWNEAIDG